MSDHPSDRPSDRPLYRSEDQALHEGFPVREMYGGDTLVFDVQVQRPPPGSPAGTLPVPVNLTGYTMWYSAKYHLADPDNQAVSFLSNGAGILYTDVLNGKAEITMPAIATRGFPAGKTRVYTTVKVKDPSGNVFTVEVAALDIYPGGVAAIS